MKMKRGKIAVLLAGIIISGVLLFSACSNILSPSAAAAGKGQGNVRVSLSAGPSGRTLMPSALDFDKYEFTFVNGTYNKIFTVDKASGAAFTFNVPVGSGYSLDVKAFKVTAEGEVLAAQGGSTASFTVSAATAVMVKLTGNLSGGTDGTFSYSVKYPAGAGIAKFVLTGGGRVIDLLEGASDAADGAGKTNAVAVPAGWYGLELDLSDESGKTAYDDDIVVIYSDTATFYGTGDTPVVFGTDDFIVPETPQPSENVGVPVDNDTWHGFTISGSGYDDPTTYDVGVGGARGTLYNTYTDTTGTYSDVLQMDPPENGYPVGGMILVYQLPLTGTYLLSMDIKVQKQNPDDPVYIGWLESNKWAFIADNSEELANTGDQPNWLSVSTKAEGEYLTEGDVIGIAADLRSLQTTMPDLHNATIYVKDLKLQVLTDDGETYTLVGTPDPSESTNLRILPANITLYSKDTQQLTVTGDALSNVSWSTSNSAVVDVSQTGFVTAARVSDEVTATITATAGDKTATTQITVRPKYIALTFDDGPDGGEYYRYDNGESTTQTLLDIAEQKGVHISLMEVGMRVALHGDITLRAFEDGNDICNHSYHHRFVDFNNGSSGYDANGVYTNYSGKSVEFYKDELMRTQDAIETATNGFAPVFFRSPNLNTEPNLLAAAAELGLPVLFAVNMSDSDFSPGYSQEAIKSDLLNTAKPWGIMLCHDYYGGFPQQDDWIGNGNNTVGAMPAIIDALQEQGYEIVTVSEMLAKRGVRYLTPGQVYYDFAGLTPEAGYPDQVIPVTGITASDTSITLAQGGTQTITVTVSPAGATHNKVYWYSADKSVVMVNANGKISAVGQGDTVITARAEHKTVKIAVTVSGIQEPVDDGGILCGAADTYNGFFIQGPNYPDNYPVAEATLYPSYKDTNGELSANVLKLEPPSPDGYAKEAMALSRKLQDSGTYRISMDVWVDKANEDDPVYLCWDHCDNNGNWEILAGSYNPGEDAAITPGEWYHLETVPEGVHFNAGYSIGFLLQNSIANIAQDARLDKVGLNGATIYIRNLVLDLVKDPVEAFDALTSWDALDISATKDSYTYAPGYAESLYPCDWQGYSNILQLSLPNGGADVSRNNSTIVMAYRVPRTGNYSLTGSFWVEKGNDPNVVVSWQTTSNTWELTGYNAPYTGAFTIVPNGGWYPFFNSSVYLNAGEVIFLLAYDGYNSNGPNGKDDGLKDATVYFRDLKLTCDGEAIIDISSPEK